MKKAVKTLAPEQASYLSEMSEQARAALGRFAGYEVAYDSVALQLLDEWIERHLRQFPNPSHRIRLLWASFLGEMFRRHYAGEWALQGSATEKALIVLCPMGDGGKRRVDVSVQIDRRIADGMSASLVYFYTVTGIELKAEE